MANQTQTPAAAGIRGQQVVNGVVGGTVDPKSIIRASKGQPSAPDGIYELAAKAWNRLTSKPGQPKVFTKHVRGELVPLTSAQAERLLRAGAVKPTTDEQAGSPAANAETPLDRAQAIDAKVGAKPLVDAEGQQQVNVPEASTTLSSPLSSTTPS